MLTKKFFTLLALLLALSASTAMAVDVTIDMNGFPNATGGQVTGDGLQEPIPLTAGEQRVVLKNLQADGTYSVDFFHNSGEHSSDFTFTMNTAGTGVARVGLTAEDFRTMVTDFKPGDGTLKLNTHTVTFNANQGQTGEYYIHGAVPAGSVGPGSDAKSLAMIPGLYPVDNLYNTAGGAEDYAIVVDDQGKVTPSKGSEEFVECSGSTVNVRSTKVHFKIEALTSFNYHSSHPTTEPVTYGNAIEFDVLMPVGGGGINVWTFGHNKVLAGDSLKGDGSPLVGTESENDFHFYPILRYDQKTQSFYFLCKAGQAQTAFAEAGGTVDIGAEKLTVKVTATILKKAEKEPTK